MFVKAFERRAKDIDYPIEQVMRNRASQDSDGECLGTWIVSPLAKSAIHFAQKPLPICLSHHR
jgi:hypothetical protein